MKIDTDFPDHLRPLLARLRATGLYAGDDSNIVCQLAIRSLRDLFEKPLIAEGAPVPAKREPRSDPAPEDEIEEIDEAPVIDPARVLHTMRRLDAEEDADEQPAGQWVRPARLTDAQASVHKVLFDAAGERLQMHDLATARMPDDLPRPHFVHPFWFSEPFYKKTGWYLKSLPPLVATNRLPEPEHGSDEWKAWNRVWRMPPGPDRGKERSRSFPGMMDAAAIQWGGYVEARAVA